MAQVIFSGDDETVDITPYIKDYEEQLERLKKLAPHIKKIGITKDDLQLLLKVM